MLTKRYASLFDRSFPAKGRWIVLIPVAMLLATSLLIYVAHVLQRDAVAIVSRSKDVEDQLHALLALLGEAEAGDRGFLLTGDETWLQAPQADFQGIPVILARLDELIADIEQRGRFARLPAVIDRRLAALDEVADEVRMLRQFPAAVSPSHLDRRRQLMTAVPSLA